MQEPNRPAPSREALALAADYNRQAAALYASLAADAEQNGNETLARSYWQRAAQNEQLAGESLAAVTA